jgi:hypothetical protein
MAPSVKIYGCAEDALTFKALNERCDEITGSFAEERIERVIFYRPSFGRGVSIKTFGEFDGIVIEKGNVFLIESKWLEDTTKNTLIELKDNQIDRHTIMRWYIDHWRGEVNWNVYYEKSQRSFSEENSGYKMPTEKDKLSEILKFILSKTYGIAGEGCKVKDVLLLFLPERTLMPNFNIPDNFKKITMRYQREDGSGFFNLMP